MLSELGAGFLIRRYVKNQSYQQMKLPDWIDARIWEEWKKMRLKIKRPLTEYGERLAVSKLTTLRREGEEPNEVIKQSILHAWQGFFRVKDKVTRISKPKLKIEPDERKMTREEFEQLKAMIDSVGKRPE